MKSSKIRKVSLFLSFMLFPIIYNYISPILMIEGAASNTVTASLIYWILFFTLSLFLGRAACGYICPLGAAQTIIDLVIGQKHKKYTHIRIIKYLLFTVWIGVFIYVLIKAGGYSSINLLFNNEKVISADSVGGLIRYYILISIPLIFTVFFGRMGFCHYICPFGLLSMFGSRLARVLRIPILHIKVENGKCKSCGQCDKVCPMDNKVSHMVTKGSVDIESCKLCGECCRACQNGTVTRQIGIVKEKL